MKNLDTSHINSTRGFPVKKGTLDFLQWKDREMISELLAELYPGANLETGVYAIRGATWALATGRYTLQPGAVYVGGNIPGSPAAAVPTPPYNTGEIFLLPNVQSITPSNQAILIVGATQYYGTPAEVAGSEVTADPVTFTDGNSFNVHDIRTLILADGDSSTPGFVCYLSALQPCANGIKVLVSNMFKATTAGAGAFSYSGSETAGNVFTFSPAPAISSNNMTFRFTGMLVFGGSGSIIINIVVGGTTIIKSGTFTLGGAGSMSFILEASPPTPSLYAAGSSVTVTGYNTDSNTGNIYSFYNAQLLMECFDAF